MKVLITGGTGLIGKALAQSLVSNGDQVTVLSRNPARASLQKNVTMIGWDGCTSKGWGHLINEMDAVVNFAGENIGSFPWSEKRKATFRTSRLNAGMALVDAFTTAVHKPGVLIQASAVGYYGPQTQQPVDEFNTQAGSDFSAKLCLDWEDSTLAIERMGVRRVIIRTGIVLDRDEGALPLMVLPVRFFAGGPLGGGNQGFPWIHIDDEVAAIQFLLAGSDLSGAFNLSAPNPISSAEFVRTLARVLHRPYWLPAPAFMLRLALGEMSTILLDGAFMRPRRLLEAGLQFKFYFAQDALNDLYK